VLRAAGETETTQENIEYRFELGFQLMTEEEIATVVFFIYFHQQSLYLLNFPFICFRSVFVFFKTTFSFINPGEPLQLVRISEDLL
jgi:hypothetical protein